MFGLRLPCAQSDRQRTAHCPHPTVQRKLADGQNVRQMLSIAEVSVSAENAKSNWQIEACTFLAHVGRRQIDRGLVKRKEESTVVDCGANPFA